MQSDGVPAIGRHPRWYAPGDGLGMVAIGRDYVIIGAEEGEGTCARRFLADVEMAEPADLP